MEINKIFVVEKGKMKRRWKVIEHPYFNALALVRDYCGMNTEFQKSDIEHISGCVTLDNAYDIAYSLT